MHNMFIHRPAFQGVAMRSTRRFSGKEPFPTASTPMPGGREAGDPASETAAALPEVKGQAGEPPIGPLGQGSPTAKGAYLTTELDAAIDPEVFLALSAGFAGLTTLEGGIRPQEDPVSLVVEIGALIDELKVREDKLARPHSRRLDGGSVSSTRATGGPPWLWRG